MKASAAERHAATARYVAIRIRPRQEELFADGNRVKHFAVLSNLWEWNAERLIQWHREKAGTIEAAAFSDHQHGGAVGATCAENAAASGRWFRQLDLAPFDGLNWPHLKACDLLFRVGLGGRSPKGDWSQGQHGAA